MSDVAMINVFINYDRAEITGQGGREERSVVSEMGGTSREDR